jgi:patatin-like phospholipase/acyl hydrolase
MKIANCLSINGGGVKGLIALHQIQYLFEKLGPKFFRTFDYIGGTSTGALITALLAKGFTPKEIIDIYEKELPKIFNKRFCAVLQGKSKYSNQYIISLATSLLGDTRLGELTQKIIIPTVNTSKSETKIFKSHDPKDAEYRLVDVIIASSAAPNYFPAYKIGNEWYKDGGLSSNNPADILLTECEGAFDEINILSITTGSLEDTVTKAEKKGNILSIPEMIDEVLYLQDMKTHGTVSTRYKKGIVKGLYERCESIIMHSSGEIDDVSKSNIISMKLDGILSVTHNKTKLDKFYLKLRTT